MIREDLVEFKRRLAAAMAVLSASGLTRSNYAPPIWRAAWMLHIPVPPPHFARVWQNIVFVGGWTVLGGGLLLRLLRHGPIALSVLLLLPIGVLVGGLSAVTYRNQARRHKFPSWELLAPPVF